MKYVVRILILIGLYGFTSCSSSNTEEKLNIAVAANMQFTVKAIAKAFTAKTGIECNLIISSSGKLTAQVEAGAPYDVFVSANMKYPKSLYKSGKTYDTPRIYAYGKLVLWTMDTLQSPSLALLQEGKIAHIATANPKMAPYGIAAQEVLAKNGLDKIVENKLVYGESILQTNQFIVTQAANIGFTSLSTVIATPMKEKGKWLQIPEDDHTPIAQGIVQLKNDKRKAAQSKQFVNFMFSSEAQNLLKAYGYGIPSNN